MSGLKPSAKEEFCRMLDERGVEWVDTGDGSTLIPAQTATNVAWDVNTWPSGKDMGDCLWVQNRHPLTPGQAIAVTMGGGKLTAEQVREAVMSADRWEKPMGNTGLTNTHLIIRDDGWQSIADELNAELGSIDDGLWPSEDSFAEHLAGVTQRQDERIAELEMNWNAAKDSANSWRERCIEFESRCYELESLLKDMYTQLSELGVM